MMEIEEIITQGNPIVMTTLQLVLEDFRRWYDFRKLSPPAGGVVHHDIEGSSGISAVTQTKVVHDSVNSVM